MITYVNSVFVSNNNNDTNIDKSIAAGDVNKGQFTVLDIDSNASTLTSNTSRFKIGMFTGKLLKGPNNNEYAEARWSNVINVADIKKISMITAPEDKEQLDTEDSITISFNDINPAVESLLGEGGKRVIVRLTFKDLPTRFRNWTESYEYVTKKGDDKNKIVDGICDIINKQQKRARVVATTTGPELIIKAMPYDDDESVDTLNWANKVRFNANIYYTDPAAEGWESLNKHYPTDVTITKTPGERYAAHAKLVRDREAQAMGYLGILNRGEGTWPIVKPAMETNLENVYNAVTIEFENTYRAADDIFRKTKQTVEIYAVNKTIIENICNAIKAAMGSNEYNKVFSKGSGNTKGTSASTQQ